LNPARDLRRAAMPAGAGFFLGLAAAFGIVAPALRPPPAAAEAPAAPVRPDFSLYQSLLDDYLSVVSAPGQPLDTRFDYEKFYDVVGRFERMSRIRKSLLQVSPAAMDEPTRLAWAINTYNFVVIDNCVEYLLVPRHGRQRYKGPRDIPLPTGSFFQGESVEIDGRKMSLDEFERTYTLGGWDRTSGTPAPATIDPRVHFALVCGAMGCPPLLPKAYSPDSLQRQLAFATKNALALPRHVTWDAAKGRLGVSQIFQWYATDFGGYERAFDFIRRNCPAAFRKAIEANKLARPGYYIPWDWNLNQTVHKKEI
jgi:hypothetical protein